MLRVTINNGEGDVDYSRFVVDQSIQISYSLNTPTTCSLSMCNYDATFIRPALRGYIKIFSTKYQRYLFTGFLTVEPTANYLALGGRDTKSNFQMFQFDYTFTSDEYLLNLKSVPFIPAWVNQTQGQILQNLAETLCPGYFNYDYIASGQLVPYQAYDPTQSWSEIAKTFGDASRFRYSVINREIHFQPYGDGGLGIVYDETDPHKMFDPAQLTTSAFSNPVVNDATVIGAQEAGNNHEDYFMGDGFTGAFALRHQVFNAGGQSGSGQAGGSIVLSESWSEGYINTQVWNYQDPQNNFNYADGALNIISGAKNPIGTSYLQALNGIELAGGLVLQHGEFVFNDVSNGIVGGIYDDATNNPDTCEAGFIISPTLAVEVTASGASGIAIQPYRLGSIIGPNPGFEVITKINKTYTLTTLVHAPAPARYAQVYRTLNGIVYGGATLSPNVLANVTWQVEEVDILTGEVTTYSYTLSNIELPSFAVYTAINNVNLNITVYSTEIYAPPLGTLAVASALGAGLLGYFYLSGNQQYTGAYTYPSGGNLPIPPAAYNTSGDYLSGGLGPEQLWPLGGSLQNQSAEIDLGTLNSTLNFYSNDLPGVGTRVRLQSWESQASVSRMQASGSIATEAFVVGDDGIRAQVITNLTPGPRTSEDCDAAAAAYVSDRVNSYYQGTYNASYLFFNQLTNDIDFFPVCGRYLKIIAPKRGIDTVNSPVGLLVTAITTTVTEMFGEILNYQLNFGPDLYLEKVLANFVEFPANVLLPQDTVVTPTPQQIQQIGTNYLPDAQSSRFDTLSISGGMAVLDLTDTMPGYPAGAYYEVRNADLNWGRADSHLLYRFYANGSYTLPRNAFEQVWYIRFVYVSQDGLTINSSRRSKVLRLYWPQTPTAPTLLYADSTTLNVDFSGDIRNIEGCELRSGGGPDIGTQYYQTIAGSEYQLMLNLEQMRGQLPINTPFGLGQYLLNAPPPTQRNFTVYFFNLMWEYSPALSVYIPPLNAPAVSLGYRWGAALQVIVGPANRVDVQSTLIQVSADSAFSVTGILVELTSTGNPGTFATNVPTTGDLWTRATFLDYISSGDWSNVLHVPQGDLVASDYLASQGSVPPAITQQNATSGGIFTYEYNDGDLTVINLPFGAVYPNGMVDVIGEESSSYSGAIDAPGPFFANTNYGFFPAIKGPTTPFPTINFNGPYLNYASTSTTAELTGQFQDGSVPLTNGPFVVQTAAHVSGTSGGGGGGTYGGGNCGCVEAKLRLLDGTDIRLGDVQVGKDILWTPTGKGSTVKRKTVFKARTATMELESGLRSCVAYGHVVKSSYWMFVGDIFSEMKETGEYMWIESERNKEDRIMGFSGIGEEKDIVMLELEGPEHVYMLDGIKCHNVVKNS